MSKMSKKIKNLQTQPIIKPERNINSKNQHKKKAKQLNRQLNKMIKKLNKL